MDNVFSWDQANPLARAKTETKKANAALSDYAMMGLGRSLRKLHRKYTEDTPDEPPTRHLRTLKKWSSRYAWQIRVEVWDEHKHREDEAQWNERRRELREQEWGKAQDLLVRVEQMLKFPLVEVTRQTDESGTPIIQIIKPVRWRESDIARFLEAASKLGRLAAEMETERKKIGVALDDVLAGLPGDFGEAVRRALAEALSEE